jgi:cell division protein FtsQ
MDGRGRLLRSLRRDGLGSSLASLAYAGVLPAPAAISMRPNLVPPVRQKRQSLPFRVLNRLAGPGTGACFSLSLLMAVGAYGYVQGGHYAAFVDANGRPADIAAKALGFSIKAVTISGERELKQQDVLAVAGIRPRNSLLFLDAEKIRERLKRLPLVKEATVTKLYPDQLLIQIDERRPFALWQCDGKVMIVADDGVPVLPMRDRRFLHLPLVVGTGASEKLGQYMSLLDSAGALRERIVAGVLVAQRSQVSPDFNKHRISSIRTSFRSICASQTVLLRD